MEPQVPDDDEALRGRLVTTAARSSSSPDGYTGEDEAAFATRPPTIVDDQRHHPHRRTPGRADPQRADRPAGRRDRGADRGDLYGDARGRAARHDAHLRRGRALSLLAITAFAAVQSGRLLAPLRTLRETADEINDTDLSRRLPETGNDDITALTRTFNRMLDRLEAAFVGQRQFLDDAGHELKTPLTVLRGHLELLDVGSPEEIAETRELLLDEVDRMSRLVGELILLAKSDRPDFVTLRPVDLTGLTVDTLAKARGLGDRTLDPRRDRQRHRPGRRAAADPGAAPALRQRGQAHRRRRRGRPRLVVRRRDRPALGPRHRPRRGAGGPRPDLRAVRAQRRAGGRRGVRAGPLDRPRDRPRARRHASRWRTSSRTERGS